ncbi:hypothetical protein AB1Y43_06545, partial [Escherichia coli]
MILQHHFLIAMPALQDPIFRSFVVYICKHNTNCLLYTSPSQRD